MKSVSVCLGLLNSLLASMILLPSMTQAQVISDGTTNTIVNSKDNDFTIINGIEKGNNLFHSFSNFSVPTNGSAKFDLVNTPNITTIFNRVTGGNISNIDGLIETINTNNAVSLFLMNPNGIIFGQNAKLNIGGSFLGTTANSIKFADGTEFSAVNTEALLLKISIPVGLQMGNNPGALTLQGTGHSLTSQNLLVAPFIPTALHNGLAVQPGNTLALVGGKINLNGGVLTASDGRVELGSVTNGIVQMILLSQGIQFNYGGLSNFDDIQLAQRSLVDINAGSIQVQGRQITFTDGSVLWAQNRGEQISGTIRVNGSRGVTLRGTSSDVTIPSGIVTETVGTAAAGNIIVATPQLMVQSAGKLSSITYSQAMGGDIATKAENLSISGYSPLSPDLYSVFGTVTVGSGKAGNVSVSTQNLSIADGGYFGSSTLSNAQGGNVVVNADAIEVRGATPAFFPSVLVSSTLGRGGNAGNLTLNTRTLTIKDHGLVVTSSIGVGSAGNLTVNASESVKISDGGSKNLYGSSIASTIDYPNTAYRQFFGLSGIPIGSSGNVVVNTPLLSLSNQGGVTSGNFAIGNAGTVQINAERIQLSDRSSISAFTNAGEGGNVQIQTQNFILRGGSSVSATAGQQGNGGNIKINTPIILGLENSDIFANAFQGRGGNIQITTQGIFGLKNRPQLTPESDITASSQFGINGTVYINNFGVDLNSGLVKLPENVTDPSQQIATGCSHHNGSSFVATGRGGIPQNPSQELRSDRPWSDTRDFHDNHKKGNVKKGNVTTQIPTSPEILVQANSWRQNHNGQIELISSESLENSQHPLGQTALNCAGVPN
jgi:filamentous hemagglutinin family protein